MGGRPTGSWSFAFPKKRVNFYTVFDSIWISWPAIQKKPHACSSAYLFEANSSHILGNRDSSRPVFNTIHTNSKFKLWAIHFINSVSLWMPSIVNAFYRESLLSWKPQLSIRPVRCSSDWTHIAISSWPKSVIHNLSYGPSGISRFKA